MKWQLFIALMVFLVLAACNKDEYVLMWTELDSPSNSRLADVTFTDELNGYAVGGTRWQHGELLQTADGGATWTLDTILNNNLNEILIQDGNIMIAGYQGFLLQYDANLMARNVIQMSEKVELHSIAYDSQNNFVAIGGGSFDIGVIYHFNSLNTQPDTSFIDFPHEIQDVCYLTPNEVVAVGYGAVFKSYDGGRTWEAKPIQGEFFLTVNFPSPSIGYAAGFTGTIIKTTDGGESWEKLRNGNRLTTKRHVFRDILFTSNDKGYLIGDEGVFWITEDGGDSWKTVDLPDTRLNAIFYNSDYDTGYIVGDEGRIFKFEDE